MVRVRSSHRSDVHSCRRGASVRAACVCPETSRRGKIHLRCWVGSRSRAAGWHSSAGCYVRGFCPPGRNDGFRRVTQCDTLCRHRSKNRHRPRTAGDCFGGGWWHCDFRWSRQPLRRARGRHVALCRCASARVPQISAAVGKDGSRRNHFARRDRGWPAIQETTLCMTANRQEFSFRSMLRFETLLFAALLAECIVFSHTGMNFATRGNALEIVKFSVEIGLLALAMTPVVLTGGIDLSVGSLLGLCAVVFGKLWRDAGLDWSLAAAATLGIGAAAGSLNALLITRLRLPPLIVTLGSFSLFRGLAETITRGVDNFTGFPPGFLALGQGYYGGVMPAQVPLFLIAAAFVWLLVHR